MESDKESLIVWGACACALAALLVYLGYQEFMLVGDGEVRFRALQALLEHGKATNTPYSMVAPLCAIPFYLLGKLCGDPALGVRYFNLVLFLVFLGLLEVSLRPWMDRAQRLTALTLLLVDSMLLSYTPYFFGEMFTACLTVLALLWFGRRPRTAWALLLLATVNTPAALPAALLVSLRWSRRVGRLRWLMLVPLAMCCYGTECLIFRSGASPLELHHVLFPSFLPYSQQTGFSYPWLMGVLNLLFSFGKGLIFFFPGLWLWFVLRRRLELEVREWVGDMLWYVAGLICVYAKWFGWTGDVAWGPRFLLIASVPACLLLAFALQRTDLDAKEEALCLFLLAASAWVGIDGAVYNLFGLESFFWGEMKQLYFATYSTVEFSPLFHPLVKGLWEVDSPLRLVLFLLVAVANLFLAIPGMARLAARLRHVRRLDLRW